MTISQELMNAVTVAMASGAAASEIIAILNAGQVAAAGTGEVSKAAVLDANGSFTFPAGTDAEVAFNGNKLSVEAGAGITAGVGTIYQSSVVKIGGIITTRILLDLTGLSSATDDLDVIGVGAGPAHLGRITAARNGTILGGRMTCLEVPASLTDIDLYSATVATAVFEDGIAALTETALLTAGGAWTAALTRILTGVPPANDYLYLVNGAADTADPFTAGKFLIELYGYDA